MARRESHANRISPADFLRSLSPEEALKYQYLEAFVAKLVREGVKSYVSDNDGTIMHHTCLEPSIDEYFENNCDPITRQQKDPFDYSAGGGKFGRMIPDIKGRDDMPDIVKGWFFDHREFEILANLLKANDIKFYLASLQGNEALQDIHELAGTKDLIDGFYGSEQVNDSINNLTKSKAGIIQAIHRQDGGKIYYAEDGGKHREKAKAALRENITCTDTLKDYEHLRNIFADISPEDRKRKLERLGVGFSGKSIKSQCDAQDLAVDEDGNVVKTRFYDSAFHPLSYIIEHAQTSQRGRSGTVFKRPVEEERGSIYMNLLDAREPTLLAPSPSIVMPAEPPYGNILEKSLRTVTPIVSASALYENSSPATASAASDLRSPAPVAAQQGHYANFEALTLTATDDPGLERLRLATRDWGEEETLPPLPTTKLDPKQLYSVSTHSPEGRRLAAARAAPENTPGEEIIMILNKNGIRSSIRVEENQNGPADRQHILNQLSAAIVDQSAGRAGLISAETQLSDARAGRFSGMRKHTAEKQVVADRRTCLTNLIKAAAEVANIVRDEYERKNDAGSAALVLAELRGAIYNACLADLNYLRLEKDTAHCIAAVHNAFFATKALVGDKVQGLKGAVENLQGRLPRQKDSIKRAFESGPQGPTLTGAALMAAFNAHFSGDSPTNTSSTSSAREGPIAVAWREASSASSSQASVAPAAAPRTGALTTGTQSEPILRRPREPLPPRVRAAPFYAPPQSQPGREALRPAATQSPLRQADGAQPSPNAADPAAQALAGRSLNPVRPK